MLPNLLPQLICHQICSKVYTSRLHFTSERELQEGIARCLSELQLDFQPEVVLTPKDRIDFLVGSVGIETKVDGSLASVTRQLFRYADLPQISHLVLITSRSRHANLPQSINEKPLFIVYLLHSLL